MKSTNKFTYSMFGERNGSFTFLWLQTQNVTATHDAILSLTPVPTHMIFNIGLYFPMVLCY